jgi:hypothetical protein
MVHLNYKSLVTKEKIESIISKLEDEQLQKDFVNTMSKIDIRIATQPIKRKDVYYYKIWVSKKGTKKKAQIKRYYNKKIDINVEDKLSLLDILILIRMNAEVPDDFEEYCDMLALDPEDKSCREEYLIDLRNAEKFKKLLTMEEIRSFPMPYDYKGYSDKENEDLGICEICDNYGNVIEEIDMNDKENPKVLEILGYKIILLNDKREYDKLADLDNALEYCMKIIESFACEIDINELNQIEVSICEDNLEKENIEKYIENYNQTMKEYTEHFRFLIKKYKIKPSGNISKRLAFTFGNDNNEQQSNKKNYKPIVAILDYKSFSEYLCNRPKKSDE